MCSSFSLTGKKKGCSSIVIDAFLKAGASTRTLFKSTNGEMWTPMHLACRMHHGDAATVLYRHDPGCINIPDSNGITPIHELRSAKRLEIVGMTGCGNDDLHFQEDDREKEKASL